jgi:hypothetical protein
MASRSRPPRRGVVLLVILSLLVLFALLGVTFVIVSGQYKRSAQSYMRAEMYGDDWVRQIDTGMYVALRDTLDPANVLRTHSLFNDLYGHNTCYGTVTGAPTNAGGGQLMNFNCTIVNSAGTAAPDEAGYFNGCVLTFFRPMGAGNNRLAGNSTRVIGSASTSGTATLRIMRPTADDANDVVLNVGDRFIINGRPFSGTGAGFDPNTGTLGYKTGSTEEALMPVRLGELLSTIGTNYLRGGANENWDAPDLQNLFLSATIPDPNHPTGIKHITINNKEYPCILPSFHRPALIRYAGGANSKNYFRPQDATFPPLGDQSLPAADRLTYGPWDVDNDGDGVADSIWVDLNMPVQTSPDGRRYKPLFAIKIADLDNRLQLNYHGNEQHYKPAGVEGDIATPTKPHYYADGSKTSANLLKGAGMGPGEVALGTDVVANVGIRGLTTTQYTYLLEGDGTRNGRYGPDKVAGNVSTIPTDIVSDTRFFPIPQNYFGGASGAYRSPPDLIGQLARGIDARGQFITDFPTDQASDLRARAVYRTRAGYDSRFTPVEFERFLRYYDLDASQLPDRIEQLASIFAGGSAVAAFNRQLVAPEGRDMPIAAVTPTTNVTKGSYRDAIALIRERIKLSGGPSSDDTKLLSLVDRDLYLGLKMNLNRPLGNAADNNGNGIIDEPLANEVGPPYANGSGFNATNGDDVNGDNMVNDSDQMLARHQLAKHLYVLASLVVDTGTSPNPVVQQQLAQWAINAVDFSDYDAIMTPFEYDPNPFDGWTSTCNGELEVNNGTTPPTPAEPINDGIIASGSPARGLVWGVERPELLLSETLVTHDRRSTDTAKEDPVDMPKTMATTVNMETDANKKDEDFDQEYLPEGLAFVELYAPWRGDVEIASREFGNNGIELNKAVDGTPVWRMLVVKGDGQTIDPDTQVGVQRTTLKNNTDRSIYFTNPSAVVDDEHGTPFFATHAITPLPPGGYAVIGSGPETADNAGNYTSYLGFRNDVVAVDQMTDDELAKTRRVVLNPTANPQFQLLSNGHTLQPEPNYGTATQPVVAVVVNQTKSGYEHFSLSEPIGKYQIPGSHTMGTPKPGGLIPLIKGTMAAPIDRPLDLSRQDIDNGKQLYKDGVIPQWRYIHLQRLANPLLAHNKVTNPYITIDSIGSDIVCFNGINKDPDNDANGGSDKDAFETLQRGDPSLNVPATPNRVLWRRTLTQQLKNALVNATPEADTAHYTKYKLHHTLGYLNSSYGKAYTADSGASAFYSWHRKGDPEIDTNDSTKLPFPWLTFNNRPFNSVYELMEVPATKPSQLTSQYRIPANLNSPYNQLSAAQDYGHLLNFYYDQANPPAGQVTGLYRIFDYLRIPSKYVEADTMLVAANFADTNSLAQNAFHPPFNWLSNYRDPGMVNVNTIYSENVWNAILGGYPRANPNLGLGPTFDQIVASRRGYEDPTGENDILYRPTGSAPPTEFAAPFRASGSGKFTPVPAMSPSEDINCTLLRKDTISTNKVPGAPYPPDPPASNLPLLGNNNSQAYNNSARNPYFRHQSLQRLSNVLTTRSNVYACWVTIGYFEVDNGGLLGQELNSDTGEIKRHRAFYMIDRSIPVGFEAGENHNVDRAILVRRYIE